MTTIRLAATRPDLVRSAVIVDVSPQVNDPTATMSRADRGTVALIFGPPVYDSFEAMAEAAVAASPRRPRSAVERGVRHNSVRLPDGRWTWRYDLFGDRSAGLSDFTPLWDDVAAITAPVMLVRGGESRFVTDDHVAQFRTRMPGLRTEVVPGAGHAVQSDQPLALARLIQELYSDGATARRYREQSSASRDGTSLRKLSQAVAFSRMCTAQALPRPMTWVRPTLAPSICRSPASPRRWVVTS